VRHRAGVMCACSRSTTRRQIDRLGAPGHSRSNGRDWRRAHGVPRQPSTLPKAVHSFANRGLRSKLAATTIRLSDDPTRRSSSGSGSSPTSTPRLRELPETAPKQSENQRRNLCSNSRRRRCQGAHGARPVGNAAARPPRVASSVRAHPRHLPVS
jgi:hypothetical protein